MVRYGVVIVCLCLLVFGKQAAANHYRRESTGVESDASGGVVENGRVHHYHHHHGPMETSANNHDQHQAYVQNHDEQHSHKIKTITITKKVPVPYEVIVEKKVPYKVEVPVDKPYHVYVPKPYPVYVEKKVPYKVEVPVPKPYTVEKKVPVPVKVPVDKPYPVYVPKPYNVYVEKKVPYTLEKHVPVPVKVPVEKPYPVPVKVEKEVPYEVEKLVPYPVEVKVDKPVPIHVEKHIPVKVEKEVQYPVEKLVPYPVQVPVKMRVPHTVHVDKYQGGSDFEHNGNSFGYPGSEQSVGGGQQKIDTAGAGDGGVIYSGTNFYGSGADKLGYHGNGEHQYAVESSPNLGGGHVAQSIANSNSFHSGSYPIGVDNRGYTAMVNDQSGANSYNLFRGSPTSANVGQQQHYTPAAQSSPNSNIFHRVNYPTDVQTAVGFNGHLNTFNIVHPNVNTQNYPSQQILAESQGHPIPGIYESAAYPGGNNRLEVNGGYQTSGSEVKVQSFENGQAGNRNHQATGYQEAIGFESVHPGKSFESSLAQSSANSNSYHGGNHPKEFSHRVKSNQNDVSQTRSVNSNFETGLAQSSANSNIIQGGVKQSSLLRSRGHVRAGKFVAQHNNGQSVDQEVAGKPVALEYGHNAGKTAPSVDEGKASSYVSSNIYGTKSGEISYSFHIGSHTAAGGEQGGSSRRYESGRDKTAPNSGGSSVPVQVEDGSRRLEHDNRTGSRSTGRSTTSVSREHAGRTAEIKEPATSYHSFSSKHTGSNKITAKAAEGTLPRAAGRKYRDHSGH